MKKQLNEFATACYNMNSIDELKSALNGAPDKTDMKTWGITEKEWRESIQSAINEMEQENN